MKIITTALLWLAIVVHSMKLLDAAETGFCASCDLLDLNRNILKSGGAGGGKSLHPFATNQTKAVSKMKEIIYHLTRILEKCLGHSFLFGPSLSYV
jgi:hypothetical protein